MKYLILLKIRNIIDIKTWTCFNDLQIFDKKASAIRANKFESQNLKSESQANNQLKNYTS